MPLKRERPAEEPWRMILRDIVALVGFFSRLPVPTTGAPATIAEAAGLWPLVGALLALPAAATLFVLRSLEMPGLVAAPLALGVGLLVSGALHEDGLADTADGLGGGRSREDRLRIMRDHAIGTYGALALSLTLIVRLAALALLASDPLAGSATLVLAAAASRGLAAAHWSRLPFARSDGLAAAVGQPGGMALAVALILSLLALVGLSVFWGGGAALLAFALASGGAILISVWSLRLIGGVTGDTIGAVQVVAETLILAALTTGWAAPSAIG